jgi:hypothetical protein
MVFEIEFSTDGKTAFFFGSFLKTGYQLQIDEPGSEPLRHGIGHIGEVLHKEIGNGIFPVDYIEYFQCGPDIIKFTERIMASAVRLIVIHQ